MIKGTLSNGFEFQIDENNLDDMRFIEALEELDEGNPLAMTKVYNIVLGKGQKEELYKFIEKEHKKVPIKVMYDLFQELMTKSKDLKN